MFTALGRHTAVANAAVQEEAEQVNVEETEIEQESALLVYDQTEDVVPEGKHVAFRIAFVTARCQWGARCRDRHPDEGESVCAARDTVQSRACKFGRKCKRRGCIFKHPGSRSS